MRRSLSFSILILLAVVNISNAQIGSPSPSPIVWGAVTNIFDASDVSTNGDLVEAFNAAGNLITNDLTINGVDFVTTGALLPNNNNTEDLFPGTTGDAAYDQFLSNIDFGGGIDVTLQVGGGALIVGEEYELQVWFLDQRTRFTPSTDLRVLTIGDGLGNNVDLNDQYVIGTFQASGSSQSLQMLTNGFPRVNLTGYQLRSIAAVPEPSSLALIGLLISGLSLRRQRRVA